MSEYYARGRAVFADAASFISFILGFLGAAPFAWPALRTAFENGAYDRGLAIFIGRIFASGLAAGLVGYVAGALAGRLWQAIHQWRRSRRQPAAFSGPGAGDAERSADDAFTTTPTGRRAVPGSASASLTCRVGPLSPSNYGALARRLGSAPKDRRYVESAAPEILTLTAWHGEEVAGVARLLSDGFGAHFITDFFVDPSYGARDVEQSLMDFAKLRVTRGGRLTRV